MLPKLYAFHDYVQVFTTYSEENTLWVHQMCENVKGYIPTLSQVMVDFTKFDKSYHLGLHIQGDYQLAYPKEIP